MEILKEIDVDEIASSMIKNFLKEIPAAFERVFDVRPVNPGKYLLKEDTDPTSRIWIRARENLGWNNCLNKLSKNVQEMILDFINVLLHI